MISLTPGPTISYFADLAQLNPDAKIDPRTLKLSTIHAGVDALIELPSSIEPSPVVIVCDEVEFLRDGISAKPLVRHLFEEAGFQVRVVHLTGDHIATTEDHIMEVQAQLHPGDTVIALGSGVVADITKHAVFEFEKSGQQLHLIVAQSANSVCAFTSGMAVISMGSVKRTLMSRLPDRLVLDQRLLLDAPAEYSNGGIGDASVAAVSFGDYRLSHLLGLTGWEPLAWQVMEFSRTRFLNQDPVLVNGGLAQVDAIAMDLAACGLAMTLAGESAPLSGLEHVTSHTLDMAAGFHQRPIGNHGSQCALATILSLIAWDILLAQDTLRLANPVDLDDEAEKSKLIQAFGPIDSDGSAWQECWRDYYSKLSTWRTHQDDLVSFSTRWSDHREELRGYIAKPVEFVSALHATNHPLAWEDIPTSITTEMAKWAFLNARLMRKRTNVADLLALAGIWDNDFINEVFTVYQRLIRPLHHSDNHNNDPGRTDLESKEFS